jgi:hypothetical protein
VHACGRGVEANAGQDVYEMVDARHQMRGQI